MNNIFKGINNHTCYFFDNIINIKDFDLSKIKADKKKQTKMLLFTTVNM